MSLSKKIWFRSSFIAFLLLPIHRVPASFVLRSRSSSGFVPNLYLFLVHAAYKRAVLKFHPDRALKSDLREQVDAEEKFKLISRMKEKFLSTCSY